jgi:pimeloyl-ACP methyl ester carboxylesterase
MTDVRDASTGAIARVPFGATDLAYATRGILYGDAALSLPLWFHQAADGRFDAFAQAYVDRARRLDADIAHGVHFGVYCAEDVPYVDWPRAHAAAAGTRIAGYLLDQYRGACTVWPRGVIPASYREPVRSAVPALLMSGRRDPVTPPRTAEDAARTLSRSRLLTWRYGGHAWDGLTGRGCRVAILREFLRTADPDRPAVECMTRDAALPFRMPGGR